MSGAGRWPLGAALADRERRRVEARADVARALAELDGRIAAREGALRGAAERRDDALRVSPSAPAGGAVTAVTADALDARLACAERLRAEALALEGVARSEAAAIDRLEGDIAARRAALAEAAAAVRAMERHREGWLAAGARARGRREDDEADDLTAWRAGR